MTMTNSEQTFEQKARELVSKMTLEEKISQIMFISPAIERLGVPAYCWWSEALHGAARAGVATVFPQSIAMASSFNTELMEEVANAISDEVRAKYNEYKKLGSIFINHGINVFAPNINIFRDPRWGRGHETYGEDTCLTGKMGVAYIKGIQGGGKYRKVDATLKHYAVHSGPEKVRNTFDARVSKEEMDKHYLAAFKYCIEKADPSSVMGAYNLVNGEPCCANKTLLTDILVDELGFKGYVVSDAGAVNTLKGCQHYTTSQVESAAIAINSGLHLEVGETYEALAEAVAMGMVKEETVTEAAVKVFTARYRLGMFADDCEYDQIPFDVVECDAHRALNRKMAQESIVLLKNDGVLPLKDDVKTIAVIGPNADELCVLLGNYNGTPSKYSTLLRGIQNGTDAKVLYAKGCHVHQPWIGGCLENYVPDAVIAAQKADVVIMCMGITPYMEGENGDPYSGGDSSGDKLEIELPAVQRELIEKIVSLGKPVVFVNVSGSCMGLAYEKENCNAVIQCFYPGAEGGEALADIIFGKVSPSGRLPVTFYESLDDLPPFEDYSMENRTYKYFKGTPVFAFGEGLTYSEIEENWIDENTAELKNKGEYDTAYSVLKYEYIPHKSLCDFKKVFIKKGETLTVKF